MAAANDQLRAARERTASLSYPEDCLSRQELAELVNVWIWEFHHKVVELNATYSNIVSIDLSAELVKLIDADYGIACVFGSEDTATPPEILFSRVPAVRPLSLVIPVGTHDTVARIHKKWRGMLSIFSID